MSFLSFLLYANFLLLLLEKQISNFINLGNTIYIIGSCLISIFLLIKVCKINILSVFFYLFVIIFFINALAMMPFTEISSVIKALWLMLSYIVLTVIIKEKNDKQFAEVQLFFIFVAWVLAIEFGMSYLFLETWRTANEGISKLLIPAPFDIYFTLMAIPFLLNKSWKNIVLVALLLLKLYLSTRTAVSAGTFVLFMMISVIIFSKNYNWFVKAILVLASIVLVFFIAVSLLALVREGDITSLQSLIARLIIWSNYIQVILDYPFGLGPQGAQRMIGFYDFSNLRMSSEWLKEIFDTKTINHRQRIYYSRPYFPSVHSVHLEFIASYGIFGFLIWLHLIVLIIKDFSFSLSGHYINFSKVYFSFLGVLIYGIFNNFNSGIFYLVLMYTIYIVYRRRRYDIRKNKL